MFVSRLKLTLIVVVFFASMFVGCSGKMVSVCVDVDHRGWSTDDAKSMDYYNIDTTSLRDISLFVLCEQGQMEPILLEVTTVTPDFLRFSETFLLESSAIKTQGNFIVRRASYRMRSIFNKEGGYVFRIRPIGGAAIIGVLAVGIELEPSLTEQ